MADPPRLFFDALPESERVHAIQLSVSLGYLKMHVWDFEAAIRLLDFCPETSGDPSGTDKQKRFLVRGWMWIACRDGGMSIYHFGTLLEKAMGSLGKCPKLLEMVDRKLLRETRKRLRRSFPRFEKVRHAIAHIGEWSPEGAYTFLLSVGAVKPGMNSDDVGVATFGFQGRRFFMMEDSVSYELSIESLAELNGILETFFAALRPAAQWTSDIISHKPHSTIHESG